MNVWALGVKIARSNARGGCRSDHVLCRSDDQRISEFPETKIQNSQNQEHNSQHKTYRISEIKNTEFPKTKIQNSQN